MIVSGISLVLEGGGMRGMFSAGVFEAFMQKELIFPHIVGVFCRCLQYCFLYVTAAAAYQTCHSKFCW